MSSWKNVCDILLRILSSWKNTLCSLRKFFRFLEKCVSAKKEEQEHKSVKKFTINVTYQNQHLNPLKRITHEIKLKISKFSVRGTQNIIVLKNDCPLTDWMNHIKIIKVAKWHNFKGLWNWHSLLRHIITETERLQNQPALHRR